MKKKESLKKNIYNIIFEADTFLGKLFDLIILVLILMSVFLVVFDSIESYNLKYKELFNILEWIITIIFSIEFLLRMYVTEKPLKYFFSFYGLVDFLSIIPIYLSLFFIGSHSMAALRALRLLRVFRIMKLSRYVFASDFLMKAIKGSLIKINVFLFFVLILCVIFGTIMFSVEGHQSGFENIPQGIYWCLVTLTTVGYGDLTPVTPLGKTIASLIMIMGYGIIAVPTGIVTSELTRRAQKSDDEIIKCKNCSFYITDLVEYNFCPNCGINQKNA